MKRLVRALVIAGLLIPTLLSGVAVAQDEALLREPTPAELAVVRPLIVLEDSGSRFPALESPFFDRFAGTPGVFGGVAETASAIESPMGDDVPFVDEVSDGRFTAYRPDSNDYYANSPYIVVNVVEITEPVSSCGSAEYREVALFLKRAGLPAIGENPNAPNDPGFGATEAIGLICRNAITRTFFGLPQDGVPVQYATPYHILEYEFQGRHFVAFYTLDPFAEYRTVVSFSSDVEDQEQYGFTRSGYKTYDDPFPPVPLSDEEKELLDGWVYDFGTSKSPDQDAEVDSEQPELTEQEPPTQVDVIEKVEADTDSGDEPDVDPAPGSDPTRATNSAGAQQDARDTANSTVPFIVGGTAAAVLTGAGIALARGRRKLVAAKGANLPMLTDREELRKVADREGLPRVGPWQQIPWWMGQDFWNDSDWEETAEGWVEYDVTKRTDSLGFGRGTNIVFVQPPQAYHHAMERGDAEARFAYWLRDDGLLIVGGKSDPEAYRYADEPDKPEPYDRKKEGTPMNLDGGPDEKKRIPPA